MIWNIKHRFPVEANIKDLDVVYYNPNDLSERAETDVQTRVKQALSEFPFKVDVVNEARVHLWYEEEFGKPIAQYTSSAEAISTWPTTASAIGLRLNSAGKLEIFAPYGLEDLLNLVVRANKVLITQDVYERKAEKWLSNWPMLSVIPWDS